MTYIKICQEEHLARANALKKFFLRDRHIQILKRGEKVKSTYASVEYWQGNHFRYQGFEPMSMYTPESMMHDQCNARSTVTF